MKTSDLTLTQTLAVPCPICGAGQGKRCELSSGGPRSSSHRDRELNAVDALDNRVAKALLTL